MTDAWRAVFAAAATLLALLALSIPFVERGSAAAAITIVSAAMLIATMLGAAVLARLEWDPF